MGPTVSMKGRYAHISLKYLHYCWDGYARGHQGKKKNTETEILGEISLSPSCDSGPMCLLTQCARRPCKHFVSYGGCWSLATFDTMRHRHVQCIDPGETVEPGHSPVLSWNISQTQAPDSPDGRNLSKKTCRESRLHLPKL